MCLCGSKIKFSEDGIFDRRPFIIQETEIDRIPGAAVFIDRVLAQYAFFYCTDLKHGLL